MKATTKAHKRRSTTAQYGIKAKIEDKHWGYPILFINKLSQCGYGIP